MQGTFLVNPEAFNREVLAFLRETAAASPGFRVIYEMPGALHLKPLRLY